jgi:integrase
MGSRKTPGVRPSSNGRRGYWELRISLGPDPHRPGRYLERSQTVGPCSERDAAKKRAEWQREVEMRAGNADARSITFGQLLDAAIEALEQAERATTTLRNYRANVDKWLRPIVGNIVLANLGPRDLDRVYAKMRRAGRSAGTIAQVHAVARRALNMAIGWGWIEVNPARGTHRPPVRRGRIAPPTIEQLTRLVRTAAEVDESMAILFEVASGVGGRRGELCGLLWRDVDWDESRIFVHQAVKQLRKDQGGVEVSDTKTHQHRTIDLPAFVIEVLRYHRAMLEERAAMFGVPIAPAGYVFSREPDCSAPLWPDWVTEAFECAREAAGLNEERDAEGLRRVRLHDLRHLYATLQLAKGVGVEVVAAQLGHAKISTTQDIYAHVLPGAGRSAAKILDDLLGPSSRRGGPVLPSLKAAG